MSYKLLTSVLGDSIKNLDTGEVIPVAPGNVHYEEFLAWVAGGGVPEAADPPAPPSANVVAQTTAKAWFVSHPNAALLFNLSIVDLDAEIDSLVDALFPALSVPPISAANKNRLKLWMKTVSHTIRALAKREGFTG